MSWSVERPSVSPWSSARWLCPASGRGWMVSSDGGPAATPAAGCCLAGIAIVSGSDGGFVGGGCQAGMRVVGSRSAPPTPEGGGATMVAATSPSPSDAPGFQMGGGGALAAGCSGASCAPAARSASVEDGAAAASSVAGADHGGDGAPTGGLGGCGAGADGAPQAGGGAGGAPQDGAGGAAGSSGFGGAPHAPGRLCPGGAPGRGGGGARSRRGPPRARGGPGRGRG